MRIVYKASEEKALCQHLNNARKETIGEAVAAAPHRSKQDLPLWGMETTRAGLSHASATMHGKEAQLLSGCNFHAASGSEPIEVAYASPDSPLERGTYLSLFDSRERLKPASLPPRDLLIEERDRAAHSSSPQTSLVFPHAAMEQLPQKDPLELRFKSMSIFEDTEPEISDELLLSRLREGEAEALSELWKRYAGLLYTQALGILHNPAEAEDIVIEVFSEVWRRASNYHPERARPVAWLVTLVRRRSIDRLRERRSYEKAGLRLAMGNGEVKASANSNGEETYHDGVEDQVHLSELRHLLEQALDYLPEPQKETVRLVYFQGLTQKEIAARTSTPLGTVKTRLELGLRKMRDRIKGTRIRSAMKIEAP